MVLFEVSVNKKEKIHCIRCFIYKHYDLPIPLSFWRDKGWKWVGKGETISSVTIIIFFITINISFPIW